MLRFDERAVFDGSSTSSGKGASGGDGGATSEIAKPASPSSPPDIHILALHGWLDNAGTWDMLAPRLVEQVTDANVTFVALVGPSCKLVCIIHGQNDRLSMPINDH